jgi:chemotaxis family two-component system response regulator PixG
MQDKQVTCHFYANKSFSSPIVFFDPQQIIVATWKSWQNWHRSILGHRSPNEAPIIKSVEELKKRTSLKTYQVLTQYIDGNKSLRDLSIYMNQDLLPLTSSLMLYIQLGLIELVEIEDLPQPLALPQTQTINTQGKLIACVDDDPRICQFIKEVVNTEGYGFMGINDSIKATPLSVFN